MTTTTLSAPDIECGGCANAILKALTGVAGIAKTEVAIEEKTVTITHDPELASVASLQTRLDHVGFPTTPVAP